MKPTGPDLLIIVGVGLLVAAVSALAGAWWAVGAAGAVFVWIGYVTNLRREAEKARAAKAPKGGS